MRRAFDGIQRSDRSSTKQPPTRRPLVSWVLAGLTVLVGLASSASALADDVAVLAGLADSIPPGHYLVLFQNNAELRPSGGFLGSFATVDRVGSGFANLKIDTNIYKRDNAFTERESIEPPAPLVGIAAGNRWAMRDSNWDVDFRDAARRVNWFYQQEGGEPVDGVIAVNATVVQDLLRLTGPAQLPTGSVSAGDFFDTLHYSIEKAYFHDPEQRLRNEPKSVLVDLASALEERLTSALLWPRVGPLLGQELREKHIQLYHGDPAVEARILGRGWGGAIDQTGADYLAINNANVGGQKSSLNVRQSTELDVKSEPSGMLFHRVTIRRMHTGDGVWPDHTNNNYLRLLLPPEAEVASGMVDGQPVLDQMDVSFEAGKTVLGTHVTAEPGQTATLSVEYRTTGQTEGYRLRFQKQSGVLAEELTVRLDGRTLFDGVITTDTTVSK